MSTTTGNNVQAAWIAHLKAQSTLTALLSNSGQIKGLQWQGEEFVYPAVRVSVDFFPGLPNCFHRATIYIDIFSEEKTSKQASNIAGVIQNLIHAVSFESVGVKSFMVDVKEVSRPNRSIFAWQSSLRVETLVA